MWKSRQGKVWIESEGYVRCGARDSFTRTESHQVKARRCGKAREWKTCIDFQKRSFDWKKNEGMTHDRDNEFWKWRINTRMRDCKATRWLTWIEPPVVLRRQHIRKSTSDWLIPPLPWVWELATSLSDILIVVDEIFLVEEWNATRWSVYARPVSTMKMSQKDEKNDTYTMNLQSNARDWCVTGWSYRKVWELEDASWSRLRKKVV